jgi:hypothetical protein
MRQRRSMLRGARVQAIMLKFEDARASRHQYPIRSRLKDDKVN